MSSAYLRESTQLSKFTSTVSEEAVAHLSVTPNLTLSIENCIHE